MGGWKRKRCKREEGGRRKRCKSVMKMQGKWFELKQHHWAMWMLVTLILIYMSDRSYLNCIKPAVEPIKLWTETFTGLFNIRFGPSVTTMVNDSVKSQLTLPFHRPPVTGLITNSRIHLKPGVGRRRYILLTPEDGTSYLQKQTLVVRLVCPWLFQWKLTAVHCGTYWKRTRSCQCQSGTIWLSTFEQV